MPVIFSILTAGSAAAQVNDEPSSRSITSQDFQKKRPATIRGGRTKSSSKKLIIPVSNQKRREKIAVVTNPGRRYQFIKRTMNPKTALPLATKPVYTRKKTEKSVSQPEEIRWQEEELGVTFWKLRPLKNYEEDAPTFDVDTGDGIDKWTAERVSSKTKFKSGDRVRFTIEPLRSGYLYIINREVYDDGKSGEAELIYPEIRTNSRNDNRVTAGRLVDIPSSDKGLTPYFRTSSKKNYIGEEIFVIISPTQLTGFNISAGVSSVRRDLLQNWLNEWNSVTDVYDASDGEGVAYTRTEQESVRTRSLTQEEPLPQTIYRFKSRVGKPLMINFQIQVKQN